MALLQKLVFLAVIFGSLRVTAGSTPKTYSDGEELGISIMGSITNADPSNNVALIKELSSGTVKAVKIGLKVLTEYVVTEVTMKYVVLQRGHGRYLVYQNKFAGEFAGMGKTEVKTDNSPLISQSGEYKEPGFERSNGKIKLTGIYRSKLIDQDLSTILMQATAIPQIQDGEIIGFKLLQIDKGSIFDKSGFMDYDVITAINGIKLNSAAGAVRTLQSLKGASHFDIDLLRSGSVQKIDVNVLAH